jgi:hypothetical protein
MATYVVNVTNVGSYDADDVILGFLVPPGAGQNGVPIKQLFGFERVHVPRGETVSVFLYPTIRDFTYVTEDGRRVPVSGEFRVEFGIPEVASAGQGFISHVLQAL